MLRKDQDAYGKAMYDYLQGEPVLEIIEREDGYFDAFPGTASYFAEFKDWPGCQQRAIRYAQGRVLDVGCGAGRIGLYLQEQGFEVLGIDNSPLALEVCRLRGLKHTSETPVTRISMSRLGTFDTVLMFGNNFGLLGNARRAKWLLKRLYGMTNRQGCILAESNDIHQTQNPDHLAYQQSNRERGRMPGQIRLRVRYHKIVTPWFDYLMVSKDEMTDLIEGTGWRIRDFIDPTKDEGYISSYIGILVKD